MNVEITVVSVRRAAIVGAWLGAVLTTPLWLLFLLSTMFQIGLSARDALGAAAVSFGTLILLFVSLVAAGSMGAAAVAWTYNFVAAKWGGIRISMVETTRI